MHLTPGEAVRGAFSWRAVCPHCGGGEMRHSRGHFEGPLASVLRLSAMRCLTCRSHFAMRSSLADTIRQDEPGADEPHDRTTPGEPLTVGPVDPAQATSHGNPSTAARGPAAVPRPADRHIPHVWWSSRAHGAALPPCPHCASHVVLPSIRTTRLQRVFGRDRFRCTTCKGSFTAADPRDTAATVAMVVLALAALAIAGTAIYNRLPTPSPPPQFVKPPPPPPPVLR